MNSELVLLVTSCHHTLLRITMYNTYSAYTILAAWPPIDDAHDVIHDFTNVHAWSEMRYNPPSLFIHSNWPVKNHAVMSRIRNEQNSKGEYAH